MADPDVALEAHEDRAVDGGHHGDLDEGEEPGEGVRVDAEAVPRPEVRHGVEQHAAQHHDQVVEGQDLKWEKGS